MDIFTVRKQNQILKFLETYTPDQVFIRTLLNKVILSTNYVKILIDKDLLVKSAKAISFGQLLNFKSNEDDILTLNYEVKLSPHRQKGTKIVIDNNKVEYNLILIQAVTKGFYYNKLVEEGRMPKEFGDSSYIHRLMQLRFLPPDIIEAILNGTQDKTLILKQLYKMSKI